MEVGAVLFGEVSLVSRQIGFSVDRVLRAKCSATATVDALVGIDKNLRHVAGGVIGGLRCDGGGSAFSDADKVLDAGIGYDVSHKKKCSLIAVRDGSNALNRAQPERLLVLRDSNHTKEDRPQSLPTEGFNKVLIYLESMRPFMLIG